MSPRHDNCRYAPKAVMADYQSCVAPASILPNLHGRKYATLNAGPIMILKSLGCIRRNTHDRWPACTLVPAASDALNGRVLGGDDQEFDGHSLGCQCWRADTTQ
jgi:hypothetical protein